LKPLVLIGFVFLLSVQASTFSSSARQSILDEHNRIRASVNPPAKYALRELTWSTTLEATANAWASLCEYGHNPLAGTISLGENSAARTGDMSSDEESMVQYAIVEKWEEEGDYYIITEDGFECTDPTSDECGHYAGMVGENMETVGCAYAVCDENSFAPDVANGIWTFIVCNYNPSAKAEDPVYTPCFDEPCNLDPNDEETTDISFSVPTVSVPSVTIPSVSVPTVSVPTTIDISTPDVTVSQDISTEDTSDSSDVLGTISFGLGDDDDNFAPVLAWSLFACALALVFL